MSVIPSIAGPGKLRVLSLNCWGLKYVAKQRRVRLLAIADWIAKSAWSSSRDSSMSAESSGENDGVGYDVIALQEIWCQEDYEVVSGRAKEAGLLYSRYFYSGAIGSGLAILSAHPITDSFIHPYTLNGYPLHIIEGDFYAQKSVCGISIEIDGIGQLEILNTHMYAPGGEGEGVEGAHRIGQAWELAKIVTSWAERGRFVILMGDLNSQPDSIILRILTSHGSLIDAFQQTRPPPPAIDSLAHIQMTPLEVLHAHGITCDSPINSYSAAKLAKKSAFDEIVVRGGKRLDYVLYRSPTSSKSQIVADSMDLALVSLVPSLGCSYSDHFGLDSFLSFIPASSTVTSSGRPRLPIPPSLYHADATFAVHVLSMALTHSRSSARLQLQLFGTACVLVPSLAIAASFQPLTSLNWIFVLLGISTGAMGSTMLYTGLVAGKWEVGSLKNVIAEIQHELDRIQ